MQVAKALSSIGLLFDIVGVSILFWEEYREKRIPGDDRPMWKSVSEKEWKRERRNYRLAFLLLTAGFMLQILGNTF